MRRDRQSGITLVELLVVMAVIGLLVALTLPAVQGAREAARRSQCTGHLRQIGLGLESYNATFKYFPPGCAAYLPTRPSQGKQLSWNVFLLPFVEQKPLWNLFDTTARFDHAANREAAGQVIPLYLCPSTSRLASDRLGQTTGDRNGNGQWDPGDDLAFTDYGGIEGVEATGYPRDLGVLRYNKPTSSAHIRDGLSNTMIVGEDSGRGATWDGQWANGENIYAVGILSSGVGDMQNNELWSDHRGGVNTLFCDGSVHFINEQIELETLFALCTRARQEVIDGDAF